MNHANKYRYENAARAAVDAMATTGKITDTEALAAMAIAFAAVGSSTGVPASLCISLFEAAWTDFALLTEKARR